VGKQASVSELPSAPVAPQLTVVSQRKDGIFTVTEWSDGRKTFSVPGEKAQAAPSSKVRIVNSEQVTKIGTGLMGVLRAVPKKGQEHGNKLDRG
jgi:hypothetical protein